MPTNSLRSESSGDGVLVVHTAFSTFGGRAGAPSDLIAALRLAAGARGTLVMPSMSDDDEQPFDPRRTPCAGMGVVADTFWRMPGVIRSDSPHAFAAIGIHAEEITAPHPIDVPHGLDSPVGRAYELDAQVLLLGVGHDANTTVHLAENLAGVRYKLPKHATVMRDGQPVRHHYSEIDHCCANFALLDSWLEARGHQQRGFVAARPHVSSARAMSWPQLSITCARTTRCSCIRADCAWSATKRGHMEP